MMEEEKSTVKKPFKRYLYLKKFEEYKLMQEEELKKMKKQAGITLILVVTVCMALIYLVVVK